MSVEKRQSLTSETALLELLERALAGAEGEVELSARRSRTGSTRFAASQVTQATEVEEVSLQARVAERGRVGAVRLGTVEPEAVRRAIEAARSIARAQAHVAVAEDAHAGFDDGKEAALPEPRAWDDATAGLSAGERTELVERAFRLAGEARLGCAGLCASGEVELAVATTAGARRAARETRFRLDLIAADERASGYAAAYGHAAACCDVDALAHRATDKAVRGRDAVDLPPGEYDVILEPEAVAEVLEWLGATSLSARAIACGSSALTGHLGAAVTSPRVTVYDDPHDPDPAALVASFDAEGTPKRRVMLIEAGVARGGVSDRQTARFTGGARSTGHAAPLGDEVPLGGVAPQHLHLAPGPDRVEDLLARVERGLWVTRFHYVNGLVDTSRAVMTGMTRDGLFLVENGRLGKGVRNLRFNEALLEALGRTDGITAARRAVATRWTSAIAVVAPTVLVRRFHYTGTSKA